MNSSTKDILDFMEVDVTLGKERKDVNSLTTDLFFTCPSSFTQSSYSTKLEEVYKW